MKIEWVDSLVLYFFILLLLSGLVHHFYKKLPPTETSDGSIVMAIGIFSLDALQKMSFTTLKLTQIITLQVLIIALYLIASYIKQYRDGSFTEMVRDMISQFGLGTWVAGTCVLATLFLQALPSLNVIIWISSFLAFILWFAYIALSSYNLGLILFKQEQLHIGIILLPTVATQSVVILSYLLFASILPTLIYQSLIALGYLFYLIGLFIIVKQTVIDQRQQIILNWHNTNSIIHGALSISGLASITTLVVNETVILSTWFLATGFLILNEGIGLLKCIYRLKHFGFFQGILVYDNSQWARVFTLGMYYAFNRNLLEHHVYTNPLIEQIVNYGQYGVLIILLFELCNYFYNQFDFQRVGT